jgi:hypothetical protein
MATPKARDTGDEKKASCCLQERSILGIGAVGQRSAHHEGGDAEFSNQNGIYDKTHVIARLKIEKTIATTRRFGTHGFTTADLF